MRWMTICMYHFLVLNMRWYRARNMSVLSTPPIKRLYKSTLAEWDTEMISSFFLSKRLTSSSGILPRKFNTIITLRLSYQAFITTTLPFFYILLDFTSTLFFHFPFTRNWTFPWSTHPQCCNIINIAFFQLGNHFWGIKQIFKKYAIFVLPQTFC